MTMDFSRSIARGAGIEPPEGRPFDGVDVLRLVETGQSVRERTLFWRARRGDRTRKAVRDGSMKYIALHEGDAVGPLVVGRIEPSGVVFLHEQVELRRRVGAR